MEDRIDAVYDVLVLARWLTFAALFALIGCTIFPFWAGAPHAGATPSRIPGATEQAVRVAAPLAVASVLGWLLATAATAAGGLSSVFDAGFLWIFFFDTPFGAVEQVDIVLAVGLVAVAFLPLLERLRRAVIAALSAALLVSQAWLGHAAEGGLTPYGWAMIASYAAHVLAGAAWLGSLPVLLIALAGNPQTEALAIMRRFSTMASIAVGIIVVSGVANTMFRIGTHVEALTTSLYGAILAVKLGLVAAMLGLAAYNRFVAVPRSPGPAARRLRSSIAAELALGCLVLGVVAVLGITAPPS